MQTLPHRFLLAGVLVGAATTAICVGHFGSAGRSVEPTTARATAHLNAVGRKPIKVKIRTRQPVAEAAQPNDPLWGESWSLAKVKAPAAWRVTTGAASTIIAVLDTGVDGGHADLQGSFVEGWDAVNEDADTADDHGHGTLVAGVIAARANGVGSVGACPRCSVMPVKVIGANGAGSSADIAEGIRWAADHGARVINMSFALSSPDDGVADAIRYAQERGALIVAAAGNAGTGEATYPAAYPGVVSVTATDFADARYAWSSYGHWVRLAAPGCSVGTAAGGAYAQFCGTSAATALVSGVAGLVGSATATGSAADLVQALSGTALKVGDFVSAGRIDVSAALTALRPARATGDARPATTQISSE